MLSARDFLASAGEAGEGAVITGGVTPDEAFTARFRRRFGRVPSTPFVLQSHDAVGTLSLRSTLSRPMLRTARSSSTARRSLTRSQPFTGLSGSVQFDEHGDRRGDTAGELGLAVYLVRNARFEPVP